MKISSHQPDPLQHHRASAFTLLEMMVSVGIFLGILVGVMVGLQIFGLRVYTLSATKLSATADARKTLNELRADIRSAKLVFVGTYTNNTFSRISNGLPQIGNALEIYSADTNDEPDQVPVIYYKNPSGSANALYSASNDVVSELADYVTNYDVFAAEDYMTNILTSYDNNPVIRITLQFYQWEYPLGIVGTNGVNAYNFYRLQARVSRRAKE
jgi:type II secretory pathway pseudopilin PulG